MNLLDTIILPVRKNFSIPAIHDFAIREYPFGASQFLVRFYYICLLFFSMILFPQWWDASSAAQGFISPFWPARWVRFVDPTVALYTIRTLFLGGAFLAAVFPEKRLARVLACIGLFEFVSLYASMWVIDVDFYTWILVALLLIFLPVHRSDSTASSLDTRKKFLLAFWGCQAIILLTYSMSGIGKIWGALFQIFLGQVHSFAPQALALHIADRLLVTNGTSLLGPWIIDHYWVGWPLFVLGGIYLHLVSFLVSFRPALHRLWGIGLILYHIGAYLTMNIGFTANVLLIAILFLYSPFTPPKILWRQAAGEIPLFGWIVRLVLRAMFLVKTT